VPRSTPGAHNPPSPPDRVYRFSGPECVWRSPAGYRAAPRFRQHVCGGRAFSWPAACTRGCTHTRRRDHRPARARPNRPAAASHPPLPPTRRHPRVRSVQLAFPATRTPPSPVAARHPALSSAPGVAAAVAADATARRLAGAGCRRTRGARPPRRSAAASLILFLLFDRSVVRPPAAPIGVPTAAASGVSAGEEARLLELGVVNTSVIQSAKGR